MRKATVQGWILITPLFIGCLLFYAIPFILVIQYSLSTGGGGSSDFIGLFNYQDVTSSGMFTLATAIAAFKVVSFMLFYLRYSSM